MSSWVQFLVQNKKKKIKTDSPKQALWGVSKIILSCLRKQGMRWVHKQSFKARNNFSHLFKRLFDSKKIIKVEKLKQGKQGVRL